jgi:CubicO group peptidase (beta-lactamase class C family)
MAEAHTRRRGRWGQVALVALAVVAGVVWIAFKAYEPFVVGGFGWSAIPQSAMLQGGYPATARAAAAWAGPGTRATARLEEARAELGAPALSAAVSVDGEVVWAGVVGYADLARLTPATLDTTFRIGSTSKAVTAVAMATLIAADEVDLDAPLSAYMPDLAEPLASVTTRQAMSHTAGVRDYGTCFCFPVIEYFNRAHFNTQRAALRPFERDDLLFPPGEGFSYSTYGYNATGGVIEAVTGERFGDFLEQAVFTPLGMAASRADDARPAPGDATFYDTSRPGLFKATFRVDNTNKLPGGGLLSTPSDLARLGAQMIAPTLFDAATRDMLMPSGRAPPFYGLGWRYQAETDFMGGTAPRLHHHGTALGSTSHFTVYPEQRMVVSVMMNTMQGPGRGLEPHAHALAEIFAAER